MYLTEEQANNNDFIRYLAGQVISEPVLSLERLDGKMGYNYELNHRYIFKLPTKKTNPEDWLRQSQYLPILQEEVSFQVPIPRVKVIQSKGDKKTFVSSLYEKIAGKCTSDTLEFSLKDEKYKINFFEQLSEAANQLHNISTRSLPLRLPTKQDILERYFFQYLGREGTHFQKKMFRKLAHSSIWGLGKSGLKTSLLSHSDLHSGNVVLNDKNKIVGILDFDTFGRGEPFWEFRPHLYSYYRDIQLFQKIYSQQTNRTIDLKDIDNMKQFISSLRVLYLLFSVSNIVSLEQEKRGEKKNVPQKKFLVKRLASYLKRDMV